MEQPEPSKKSVESAKIDKEKLQNPEDVNDGTCDCNDETCEGCFWPCDACSSNKCGPECRINRNWKYEKWIRQGRDDII